MDPKEQQPTDPPVKPPRYTCGVCGLAVAVLADAGQTSIVRACPCKGAVVANMSGEASGHGGFKRS